MVIQITRPLQLYPRFGVHQKILRSVKGFTRIDPAAADDAPAPVLTAGIVGVWITSLSAGSSLRSGSVDPHELTLKAKELPVQEVKELY